MQIENKLTVPIIVEVEVEPAITIPANSTQDVYLNIKKITIKPSV